jgi:hypothetical protein
VGAPFIQANTLDNNAIFQTRFVVTPVLAPDIQTLPLGIGGQQNLSKWISPLLGSIFRCVSLHHEVTITFYGREMR